MKPIAPKVFKFNGDSSAVENKMFVSNSALLKHTFVCKIQSPVFQSRKLKASKMNAKLVDLL